ncbi:MAG: cobalt-precorrin-5B (C(1))-methyltransferase, partial [Roseburia sp.]|nr:cobalt-precorrin-5B (C(1))-methyltransferase [Roseburia sp.]
MRYGFTTGSCAAAAAKAAAYMLLTGKRKEQITIETPKGIPYHAMIEEIEITERAVRCAVRKDGGDDPDVTTGILIAAEVSELQTSQRLKADAPHIEIAGGTGVGIVTRPGLDQPVGAAAINHVPREMIEREVAE